MILATATIALAVCCPAIDFSHGTLDWNGLRESCGDIEASDATKLSLEDLTVFRIAPDRYAFVHASVGCLESPFRRTLSILQVTTTSNLPFLRPPTSPTSQFHGTPTTSSSSSAGYDQ